MTLSSQWEIEQAWGSHQPTLLSLLKVLQPVYAVELGCGDFSTPHMRALSLNLLTVEHDPAWAKRMQKKFEANSHHEWLVEPLRAHNGQAIEELPDGEWEKVKNFYTQLGQRSGLIEFLFVDTFRCARVPAILGLMHLTDVILLHDLEQSSPEYYQYQRLTEALESWHHYMHRPPGFVADVHKVPWTAVYSRHPLPLGEMNVVVRKESKRLWGVESVLEKNDG